MCVYFNSNTNFSLSLSFNLYFNYLFLWMKWKYKIYRVWSTQYTATPPPTVSSNEYMKKKIYIYFSFNRDIIFSYMNHIFLLSNTIVCSHKFFVIFLRIKAFVSDKINKYILLFIPYLIIKFHNTLTHEFDYFVLRSSEISAISKPKRSIPLFNFTLCPHFTFAEIY